MYIYIYIYVNMSHQFKNYEFSILFDLTFILGFLCPFWSSWIMTRIVIIITHAHAHTHTHTHTHTDTYIYMPLQPYKYIINIFLCWLCFFFLERQILILVQNCRHTFTINFFIFFTKCVTHFLTHFRFLLTTALAK